LPNANSSRSTDTLLFEKKRREQPIQITAISLIEEPYFKCAAKILKLGHKKIPAPGFKNRPLKQVAEV